MWFDLFVFATLMMIDRHTVVNGVFARHLNYTTIIIFRRLYQVELSVDA